MMKFKLKKNHRLYIKRKKLKNGEKFTIIMNNIVKLHSLLVFSFFLKSPEYQVSKFYCLVCIIFFSYDKKSQV